MAARPAGPQIVFLTMLVCIAATAMAGEQPGPFSTSVWVVADHTYLRAGPGDDYYPTERLTTGATLEAWAVDASGYVAVRPIEGSFSWLRACDVDDTAAVAGDAAKNAAAATQPAGGQRHGVIVTDGVVSRVGSQLNDLRHVAQVSLEAGKRVHVLEEVRIDAGRHAGLWVRIEPPAGEFRWARLADLKTPPGFVPPALREALSVAKAPESTASLGDAVTAIKEAIDARITRFETIQSRRITLADAPTPAADSTLQHGGMWSSLSSIGSRPIRTGVLPGGQPSDDQPTWKPPDSAETSGRLTMVVSRRPDAPRWAIVDQSNNVIAFITPQTGVNLAPLVGQDVAVRGARGYMPEYKRPYVVVAEARVRMAAQPEASPDRATQ
ncbi:MAG: hypothetical protein WD060_09360 [Pirellulales bacterium]